jgi:hypothetical protein
MKAVALGALLAATIACEPRESTSPATANAPATPPAPAAPRAQRGERAWSAQLHVHGSFSEGIGSVDSHSWEASRAKVDVVWWSDHDTILASDRRTTRFGFEGFEEPFDRGESWKARSDTELASRKRLYLLRWPSVGPPAVGFPADDPLEGERSLRLSVSAPSEAPEELVYYFLPDGSWHRRPLAAQVTLRVGVFPEQLGPDATCTIDLELSEHPAPDRTELVRSVLRYQLSASEAPPRSQGGLLVFPLRYEPARWNSYELPLVEHVQRLLPALDAEDNTVLNLAFGVHARRGATAAARFDGLQIDHEISGPALYARQAELIERTARRYPELREYQGVEIDAQPHLNEFSVGTELLDYAALVREFGRPEPFSEADFRRFVAERAVAAAHARGGVVSYNHMFGVQMAGKPGTLDVDAVLADLRATRAFGADLLEVGYRDRGGRPLADHLRVWDALARDGLFLVGTGVSDSHGGPDQRWRTSPNNFVSWILAPTLERADLIEGLRGGRVFFGDIWSFDGEMDLETDAGHAMGRIVVTDRKSVAVRLFGSGLAAGDEIAIVESGRRTAVHASPGETLALEHVVSLEATPALVRFEVRGANGAEKAFSNPLWFVRAPGQEGIAAARAAVDYGGVASRSVAAFTLRGVALEDGGRVLRLQGSARGGSLVLDTIGFGEVGDVRFEGLSGGSRREDGLLVLEGLEGEGAVRLVREE